MNIKHVIYRYIIRVTFQIILLYGEYLEILFNTNVTMRCSLFIFSENHKY